MSLIVLAWVDRGPEHRRSAQRYLVVDAFILGDEGGLRYVRGPTGALVRELGTLILDDGSTGSVDVSREPQPFRGLMRYALASVPLHDPASGDVVGLIHPGTLVAVQAREVYHLVAPGVPFGKRVFRVTHGLGVEPTASVEGEYEGAGTRRRCRPMRWRSLGGSASGWTHPCADVWLGPEPGVIRQIVRGVELHAQVDGTDYEGCLAQAAPVDPCSPTVVVERGGELFLEGWQTLGALVPVERAPDGMVPVPARFVAEDRERETPYGLFVAATRVECHLLGFDVYSGLRVWREGDSEFTVRTRLPEDTRALSLRDTYQTFSTAESCRAAAEAAERALNGRDSSGGPLWLVAAGSQVSLFNRISRFDSQRIEAALLKCRRGR